MLVTASQEAGVLEEDEEQMLHRVFGFADLTAGHVMVPRTEMIAVPAEVCRNLRRLSWLVGPRRLNRCSRDSDMRPPPALGGLNHRTKPLNSTQSVRAQPSRGVPPGPGGSGLLPRATDPEGSFKALCMMRRTRTEEVSA